MGYYQGDYYQGDLLGRLRRFAKKRIAPALRRASPLLAFVPGVGVVGAGAISALAKQKQPNATTADTLMRVLSGPTPEGARKELGVKGRAKTVRAVPSAPLRRSTATPRRAVSPLQRSRGRTVGARRVMSPYRRNQLARARAAAARGRR
jgi:hypothetical protein